MSDSKLPTYVDTGHGKYTSRTHPITRITIHHLASIGDLSRITSVIRHNEVSWNYGISKDGKIGLFVPEEFASWSTSSTDNDMQAVNIVVCNSKLGPSWEVSPIAVASLTKLCYDICVRNSISKLSYTGHVSTSNITLHRWFDNEVSCPGPDLLSKIPELVDTVNEWLHEHTVDTWKQEDLFTIRVEVAISESGEYLTASDIEQIEADKSETSTTGSNSDSSSNGNDATPETAGYTIEWIEIEEGTIIDFPFLDYDIKVNREALHPYIATLSEKTEDVDYQNLTNMGAIGVMLYGGCLFDNDHHTQKYQPGRLRSQVEQANNANFPFGLYVKVRSTNVAEARTELSHLYQVVSKYPPELGIWLQLEMPINDRRTCDSILSCYYKCIQNWQIHFRCGLYVTETQLNKITWKDFKQYFLLNLVDHVSKASKLDEVLTQSFFNI